MENNNMENILFGVRKELLENQEKRSELKKYLEHGHALPLTVITNICHGVAHCFSCFPANVSFDVKKLPAVNSEKWIEAVKQLVSSQSAPDDVVWFPSLDRALYYIESQK